jgi:hypothetical protein
MGVVVTLDPGVFAAQFPEFAYLSGPQVVGYFAMATSMHRNDGGGPIATAVVQSQALYFLAAHFAQLFAATSSGQPASTLVGRVSDASEGSVNVSAAFPEGTPTMAWYAQTKYGAAYWQITAPYRTMRYIPNLKSRRAALGGFVGTPNVNPNDPTFST